MNGARDVTPSESGVNWLGRDASGEVVDISGNTAIDLSATDATTAQIGGPYDTRGGKSLALYTELTDYGTNDGLNELVFSRVAGLPWMIIPAIETSTDANTPALSYTTTWAGLGAYAPANGVELTAWLDLWAGLLDETIIVCQPLNTGVVAAVTTAFGDANADLTFSLPQSLNGDYGNLFSVQFVDPGLPSQRLHVESNDGYLMQLMLGTDDVGAIVTFAQEVADILTGPPNTLGAGAAPFAIRATLVGDGTGVVAATAVLPLVDGASSAVGVTYRVRGSL